MDSPWIQKYQNNSTVEDNFLKTDIIQNLMLFHVYTKLILRMA